MARRDRGSPCQDRGSENEGGTILEKIWRSAVLVVGAVNTPSSPLFSLLPFPLPPLTPSSPSSLFNFFTAKQYDALLVHRTINRVWLCGSWVRNIHLDHDNKKGLIAVNCGPLLRRKEHKKHAVVLLSAFTAIYYRLAFLSMMHLIVMCHPPPPCLGLFLTVP